MICPKCGKETEILYSYSENMKNLQCPECVDGCDVLIAGFVLFAVLMTFLGSLAG